MMPEEITREAAIALRAQLIRIEPRDRQAALDAVFGILIEHVASLTLGQVGDLGLRCDEELDRRLSEEDRQTLNSSPPTIGDLSMSRQEIQIGDALRRMIDNGEIRGEDVPRLLANAALRALDDRIAYSISGCPEECCVKISAQPTHRWIAIGGDPTRGPSCT